MNSLWVFSNARTKDSRARDGLHPVQYILPSLANGSRQPFAECLIGPYLLCQGLEGLVSTGGDHLLPPQKAHELVRIFWLDGIVVIDPELANTVSKGDKVFQVDLPPLFDGGMSLLDGSRQILIIMLFDGF